MVNNISYRKLLKWFIIEEGRLFTTLFGKNRFIFFPIVIFLFSIILGLAAPILNTSIENIAIVYFSIIAIFGLQTGSIGFEARDSINNLIGETSRILYTSKTLPIKKQTLVLLLLIKDAIFYSVMFLAPISIGVLVGLLFSPMENAYLIESLSASSFIYTYISSIIIFMFGVSLGFIFTTIRLERISGIIILSILLAFVGVLYQDNNFSLNAAGNIPLSYWMLGISASTIIFILMGLIQFRNPDKLSIKNTFKNRYVTMRNLIKPKNNYTKIFLKNLIDIQRSAGGFLKIIFSASIIVITTFLLMYFMGRFFGLAAKEEFIYSSLFALITYPIYAILFRYDSIDTYSTLPISKNEVYLSKILFYTVIVLPLSLILYTAFVISNFDISLYVQGVIILFGLQYYQLGLLMYLGGDSPNRLLFDGVSFMIYSLATLLFMTPILIIGMYGILLPSAYITISTLLGLTASIIGCILIYSLFTNNTLDYL